MENKSLGSDISLKIAEARSIKDPKVIRRIIEQYPIQDIADAFNYLTTDQLLFFLRSVKSDDQIDWFNLIEVEKQSELILAMSNPEIKELIDDLDSDDFVDILEILPTSTIKRILSIASADSRKNANLLLSFHDSEIGSIMNVEFCELKFDWTVAKAITEIRRTRDMVENYGIYYITDNSGKVVGKTTLEDLVFCKNQSKKIDTLMDNEFIKIRVKQPISEASKFFEKYEVEAIAVVDYSDHLLGIVTDNDIVSQVVEEATEDINKMSGIRDMKYPYMKASTWTIFKSRILWLSFLMVSATLSSIVIELFSNYGARVTSSVSTALLIPIMTVISGSSGNAGSQASVSVIRGLSIGEINGKDYRKVLWKELKVSFFLGGVLAILNLARLALFYLIFQPETSLSEHAPETAPLYDNPYSLAIIVACASSVCLWLAIIMAKIVGSILPLVANALKIDPAAMAAPLLTTLLDAASTAIFFGIGILVIWSTLPI